MIQLAGCGPVAADVAIITMPGWYDFRCIAQCTELNGGKGFSIRMYLNEVPIAEMNLFSVIQQTLAFQAFAQPGQTWHIQCSAPRAWPNWTLAFSLERRGDEI